MSTTALGIPALFGLLGVVLILGTLYFIECAAFFFGVRWYYGLGPAFHREEWQTSVTVEAAQAAIAQNLLRCGLVHYQWRDGFGFRRPWYKMGTWPRGLLRVRESGERAILVYEVRPFVGMALFSIASLACLILPGFRAPHLVFGFIGFAAMIGGLYIYYWRRELREFNRLSYLRWSLIEIGVLVCNQCGYDLHGRHSGDPCPECGVVPLPQADPIAPPVKDMTAAPPPRT